MSQTKQNKTTPSTKMPYQSPKLTKLGGVNELTETTQNFSSVNDDGGSGFSIYGS